MRPRSTASSARVFGTTADGTRDQYFQQVGLSLETYGKWVDFRTNFYLPVGQTTQQSSSAMVAGSAQYVGENLIYNQLNTYLAAMKGLDMEVGFLLPGQFCRRPRHPRLRRLVRLRRRPGRPHPRRLGPRAGEHRLGARCVRSGDERQLFRYARASSSVSWTFGPLHRSNLSQDNTKGRMGERVTRNYTVLVTPQNQVAKRALSPSTRPRAGRT